MATVFYALVYNREEEKPGVWAHSTTIRGLVNAMYNHMYVALDFENEVEEKKARRKLCEYITAEITRHDYILRIAFDYGNGAVTGDADCGDVFYVQQNEIDMCGS